MRCSSALLVAWAAALSLSSVLVTALVAPCTVSPLRLSKIVLYSQPRRCSSQLFALQPKLDHLNGVLQQQPQPQPQPAASKHTASSTRSMLIKGALACGLLLSLRTKGVQQLLSTGTGTMTMSMSMSMSGAKRDSLLMLLATSAVIPLCRRLRTSPIVGFLLIGALLGPRGMDLVADTHAVDALGELGIVFFLFEMGLELSAERLRAMRRDVFGLGGCQYLLSAIAIASAGVRCGLSPAAAVTVGGSLALSSSAFVLQLLKDRGALGTAHGKAALGILLLQDLAVVPLIVVVRLLAEGGQGLGKALAVAALKAVATVAVLGALGQRLLNPAFAAVARADSHEAFLALVLATVLLMSSVTKGVGLSDTLGAFVAGLLLSATSYRYQIEADVAPLRGLLLGMFFVTVGFAIDTSLLIEQPFHALGALGALLIGKAAIGTALAMAFGVPLGGALQAGLLTAQGGEFAFVSLGIARRTGLLDERLCRLLLTTAALSMALTPALAELGAALARRLEAGTGLAYYTGRDRSGHRQADDSSAFVFVCGYGAVGRMVCDMLDRRLVRYIVLESNPRKAMEARSRGLPVFFGDISRPEVLKHFHVGAAQACVLTMDDMAATNKALIRLRKLFPAVPMVVRATDGQHQQRIESMFDNVQAVSAATPDEVLLALPFGGAVLQRIGVAQAEVEAILEDVRRNHHPHPAEEDQEEETEEEQGGG